MDTQTLKSFYVVGIAVRTTNENGQSAKDIPALWNQFMTAGISDKIPNRTDNTIYSIYTAYEGDYTKPYTTVLGCKVNNPEDVPEGMKVIKINAGDYILCKAKRDMVYNEWTRIWNADIPRAYTTDFEVYAENAGEDVDIFLSVNPV